MRNVHKWDDSNAKHVKVLYGKRKPYVFSKAKEVPPSKKRYRFHKACPIFGCRAVVKDMSRHLRACHKLKQKTYKNLLKESVIVDYTKVKKQSISCANAGTGIPFAAASFSSDSDDSYVPKHSGHSDNEDIENFLKVDNENFSEDTNTCQSIYAISNSKACSFAFDDQEKMCKPTEIPHQEETEAILNCNACSSTLDDQEKVCKPTEILHQEETEAM